MPQKCLWWKRGANQMHSLAVKAPQYLALFTAKGVGARSDWELCYLHIQTRPTVNGGTLSV